MSDYQRMIAGALAGSYAEGTAAAWERKMAQEEADEQAEEAKREQMAGIPHWSQPWLGDPNFCSRCGMRIDNRIHNTRKEDK